MLRRLLSNSQLRLLNLEIRRFARGNGSTRRERIPISGDQDKSKSNSTDNDSPTTSTSDQSPSNIDRLKSPPSNRLDRSKITDLLENSTTDYLRVETAETQDPWSSPPYPNTPLARPNQAQSQHSIRPPGEDPRKTSIVLFPGQGAQYVGMANGLTQYPNVERMFEMASDLLGYDLLKLCNEGPVEELNRTVRCQPAIFVTSLACVERVKAKQPEHIQSCITTAGFSVGEIAALVFADALSFEDGLKFIKIRAESMQKASEQVPSGLLSVYIRADSKLIEAKADAIAHMKSNGHDNPVCQIANHLFTQVKVIGGHEMALQFISDHASDYNLRCKRLPVSGAFHTPLMRSAYEVLKEEIKSLRIVQPLIPVHSNIDGRVYRSADMIRRHLPKQIISPVRWEQIMHIIYTRTEGQRFPTTLEMGPGRQLGVMLNKTNAKAGQFYISYDVANENPY